MHSTNNLEDGYMGSGKRLRRSIRKYGGDNHTKEILAFYDNRELLVEAEIKAITPEMVGDKDCMNLMGGGNGGFISDEQQRYRSECAVAARIKKGKDNPEWAERYRINLILATKKRITEGKQPTWGDTHSWAGESHSEETKQKISKSMKGLGAGKNNSQYGSCWITKGGSNKKIKKEDLNEHLVIGWNKGRKI
tara:strand:+ start:14759 stop:15337 length:579 start_codon:yes stop_codon:yes gene_type:complete